MHNSVMLQCLFMVIAGIILSSCHKHDKDEHPTDKTVARTVLVYMVAENTLSDYATYEGYDIDEMLSASSSLSDNDRLVIYLDNVLNPRIYIITNKNKATTFAELKPAHSYKEDFNSASAETLDEILSYTIKHCPADEYGIVFWSHATGWIPYHGNTNNVSRRSFGVDNGKNISGTGANIGPQMNIEDIAAVLGKYPEMEFILFDACFMQCIEVAYELRGCTKYLIGSPAEIPATGAPYEKVIPAMFTNDLNVGDIAQAYYNGYAYGSFYGSLLSVIDCHKVNSLANITRSIVQAHKQDLLEADYSGVQNYYKWEYNTSGNILPDYYDMKGVFQNIIPDYESNDEYKKWLETLDATVVKQLHTNSWYSLFPVTSSNGSIFTLDEKQYSGVTMFVPLDKYKNSSTLCSDYLNTEWGKKIFN